MGNEEREREREREGDAHARTHARTRTYTRTHARGVGVGGKKKKTKFEITSCCIVCRNKLSRKLEGMGGLTVTGVTRERILLLWRT